MNGDMMTTTTFRRDRDHKAVAGICSALAERSGLDVTVVRALTAVGAMLSGGTVAVVYLVLWALLPEEGQTRTYFDDAVARGRSMYEDYQAKKNPSAQPGPAPQTPQPQNPTDPSDPYHLYQD